MGFMSAYDGTVRVAVPHPDREYWVELRKYLTHGATEKSARALESLELVDGKPRPTPNLYQSQCERMLASLVGWNLDDDNGTVWPINMQSVRRLPEPVFDQLNRVIEENNKAPTTEEQRRFPAGGVGGDPDGHAGAAVPEDVPGGAGAVEAAWAEA